MPLCAGHGNEGASLDGPPSLKKCLNQVSEITSWTHQFLSTVSQVITVCLGYVDKAMPEELDDLNPISGAIFNFSLSNISTFYPNLKLKTNSRNFSRDSGVQSRTEDDIVYYMYYRGKCVLTCLKITGLHQIHQFCFRPFCPAFLQFPNTSLSVLQSTYPRSPACRASQLFLSSTSLSKSSRKQESKCHFFFVYALESHPNEDLLLPL